MLVKNVSHALVIALAFSVAPMAQAHGGADCTAHAATSSVQAAKNFVVEKAQNLVKACTWENNVQNLKLLASAALVTSLIYVLCFKKPVVKPEDVDHGSAIANFIQKRFFGQCPKKKEKYKFHYNADGSLKDMELIKCPSSGFVGSSLELLSSCAPALAIVLLLVKNNLINVPENLNAPAELAQAIGSKLKA